MAELSHRRSTFLSRLPPPRQPATTTTTAAAAATATTKTRRGALERTRCGRIVRVPARRGGAGNEKAGGRSPGTSSPTCPITTTDVVAFVVRPRHGHVTRTTTTPRVRRAGTATATSSGVRRTARRGVHYPPRYTFCHDEQRARRVGGRCTPLGTSVLPRRAARAEEGGGALSPLGTSFLPRRAAPVGGGGLSPPQLLFLYHDEQRAR